MITWMQRHKKYLVITIWISTIAFVGAGFVGWGAYDLNKDRAASVAKVGDQTISVQEFQTAYANYYNYYNNILGGKLTQEEADQMGIDKMVMSTLINQTLLLNYAKDMGITATEDNVKELLINNANFQENGVFNKNIYYSSLKARRMTPSEYENGLKKDIIITKLQSFLKLPASETEINLFASAFFMEDKLAVSPVTLDASDIVIKEEDIKAFWEKNKANYLTKKSFNLELVKFPLSTNAIDDKDLKAFFELEKYNYKHDDGKLMSFEEAKDKALIDLRFKNDKKAALETFIAFRDGKIPATETKVIYEDDTTLPIDKIQVAAKNEVLKPVPIKDGYVIIKVKEIQLPEPMSYEMAKKSAYNDLLTQTKATALENKAQARLSTFNGTTVGFVSRDTVKSIAGLTEAKSAEFLSYVFDNTTKKGYKIIDDKAILYEVLEQKLLNEEKAKQYVSMISENVAQVKQTELNQNLIKKLASQYKVEQYYKGK